MHEISNNESYEHEHISYPLIDRLAITRHRRRGHAFAMSELQKPGEEEGDEDQGANSHRTHFPINSKFLDTKRRKIIVMLE